MKSQFELTHGMEEFVVLITTNSNRYHVWSAKDLEQANLWVDFWSNRGCIAMIIKMSDYLKGRNESRLSE